VKPFSLAVLSKNAYYFVVPEGAATHPSVTAFRDWLLQSIERVRGDRQKH
jgi:DNA-binding transcriptional LysR family regulator